MDLPDFGKQVGPLPLGAWIAVVGGGLGIAYYSSRSRGNDEPIYVNDSAGVVGVGNGGFGAWTPTDGGSLTGPIAETSITSNTQWGNQAFTFLVSMGNDAAIADKAVRDYLSGIPLGMQSNAMIALALAKYGQPPEGLPDAPAIPSKPTTPVKKPTTPGKKPPHVRTVTVRPGDTLRKIAMRAYGNPVRWREIWIVNKEKIGGNPSNLKTGSLLVIP